MEFDDMYELTIEDRIIIEKLKIIMYDNDVKNGIIKA